MILRRVLFFLASATALAVSAGVIVVALAFALYALVKPEVGPAGGAAVVAAAAAILIALIGWAMSLAGRPSRRRPARSAEGAIDRVLDYVRDRPVTSIAAAVAAGLIAVRNPRYLGTAIRSFVDGQDWRRR